MTPVRMRLSRARGFRLQEASRAINGLPAVRVDRSTVWGNHAARRKLLTGQAAVDEFRRWIEQEASEAWKGRARIELAHHNLACWCGEAPCHADVLLKLANGMR